MVLTGDDISACWRAGPASGLTRDQGQFPAEVVEMQEGHGPGDGREPEGDGGTSPGAPWVPWTEPTSASSGEPGPAQPGPAQPGHGESGYGQPGRHAYP